MNQRTEVSPSDELQRRMIAYRDCILYCWNQHIRLLENPEHRLINLKEALLVAIVGDLVEIDYIPDSPICTIGIHILNHDGIMTSPWNEGQWSLVPIARSSSDLLFIDFFDFVDSWKSYDYRYVYACDESQESKYLVPFENIEFRVRKGGGKGDNEKGTF